MTTPNSILAEACAGTIDGISAIWGPSAVNNLSSSAQDYDVNRGVLKRATENVAVKCAKRIGKTSFRILYEAIFNPGLSPHSSSMLTILQRFIP